MSSRSWFFFAASEGQFFCHFSVITWGTDRKAHAWLQRGGEGRVCLESALGQTKLVPGTILPSANQQHLVVLVWTRRRLWQVCLVGQPAPTRPIGVIWLFFFEGEAKGWGGHDGCTNGSFPTVATATFSTRPRSFWSLSKCAWKALWKVTWKVRHSLSQTGCDMAGNPERDRTPTRHLLWQSWPSGSSALWPFRRRLVRRDRFW